MAPPAPTLAPREIAGRCATAALAKHDEVSVLGVWLPLREPVLHADCERRLPPALLQVAPTFLLYKNGQQVASMTGAKTEQLRELIEQHM